MLRYITTTIHSLVTTAVEPLNLTKYDPQPSTQNWISDIYQFLICWFVSAAIASTLISIPISIACLPFVLMTILPAAVFYLIIRYSVKVLLAFVGPNGLFWKTIGLVLGKGGSLFSNIASRTLGRVFGSNSKNTNSIHKLEHGNIHLNSGNIYNKSLNLESGILDLPEKDWRVTDRHPSNERKYSTDRHSLERSLERHSDRHLNDWHSDRYSDRHTTDRHIERQNLSRQETLYIPENNQRYVALTSSSKLSLISAMETISSNNDIEFELLDISNTLEISICSELLTRTLRSNNSIFVKIGPDKKKNMNHILACWRAGVSRDLNSLIGFVEYIHKAEEKHYFIEKLIMNGLFEGHGYSRKLVKHLQSVAVASKIETIEVWSVWNAEKFYKALGFVDVMVEEKEFKREKRVAGEFGPLLLWLANRK